MKSFGFIQIITISLILFVSIPPLAFGLGCHCDREMTPTAAHDCCAEEKGAPASPNPTMPCNDCQCALLAHSTPFVPVLVSESQHPLEEKVVLHFMSEERVELNSFSLVPTPPPQIERSFL